MPKVFFMLQESIPGEWRAFSQLQESPSIAYEPWAVPHPHRGYNLLNDADRAALLAMKPYLHVNDQRWVDSALAFPKESIGREDSR